MELCTNKELEPFGKSLILPICYGGKVQRETSDDKFNQLKITSVIRQKGQISKRVFQENKGSQISKQRTFLDCFSENLACFVFLKHSF